MVQAEGKRSCRAAVQDERTESSWEPWEADKVSRSDDGTLTLRDLLVKAAARRFLVRFDRVGQGHTSMCVRYTSNHDRSVRDNNRGIVPIAPRPNVGRNA